MLDLVDHHQPFEGLERQLRVGEPCAVCGVLEVEDGDRPLPVFQELAGQGRLAHLPGAQEPDDGKLLQEALQLRPVMCSLDHLGHATMKIEY